MTIETFIAVFLALGISAFLTQRFCSPVSWPHILDHPNERSLHTRPTPRSGGVAIVIGILVGMTLWMALAGVPRTLGWLGACALMVAGMSFLDDMKGMSVGSRFVGHLVTSGMLLASGLGLVTLEMTGLVWEWPAWLGVTFSLLYLIWMINLYNFMDGMDGFAAGMAVIGFGTFALLGYLANNPDFVTLNLMIVAAVAGFLWFNFPPARIFMGDTGSSLLGLLAGGLSIYGAREGVFPFWVALLVFSPFIVDATVTLVRRLFRGERVWQAHKSHYYQRLVQLGWGHRKTVLAEYVLMLACAGRAVWAVTGSTSVQFAILGFWIFAYALLMGLVHALERLTGC